MNKIDYENIQRELDSRKVKFKVGGDLSTAEIKIKTTEELERILEDSKKTKPIDWIAELKQSVDKAFDFFGHTGEYMIVLEVINRSSNGWNAVGFIDKEYPGVVPTVTSAQDFGLSIDYDMCINDIMCCLEELKEENCRKYVESYDREKMYKGAFTVISKDYEYKIFLIDEDENVTIRTIKQF